MSIQACIAEADSLLAGASDPTRVGSDLSVFLEKIAEWVKSIDLSGLAMDALHALLHYTIDVLIPKLKEIAPTHLDVIMDAVLIPILKKIDENFHSEPTPA